MSGELRHSHRALVSAHARRERALLRALPRHLGVADARGDWAFATLPPLLALPQFLGHLADEVLQAHHFACFWGLATDRVADGQATGDLTEAIALHRAAWQRALSQLTTPARATTLVRRADALQRRGFALERHLFAQRRCTPRDYARCLALRTAWFPATALQLVPARRRRATERGLQQLMLSLQLLDDAVDADDDTRARGASWPAMLRVAPTELHTAAVSMALRAGDTLLGAGHGLLVAWCRQRARAVSRAFSVPLPEPAHRPFLRGERVRLRQYW